MAMHRMVQEGSYYIYTETSRPNYPSKEFVLESGVLGLSAAWTAALSLSGDQGNEWFHALLTLPASATKLRLKVVSGRSYRGDVAVDNITLIPLDTASARDSMVMTAEQTFVAQTLGHEFVFHSGGTACRTVFFDATDGNCQQRCGETLNCRFYTTWSDARCQMAETCDAVSEPRALTFQKARARQRAVQALQVTSAEGEEAAVVNSSGQAELQDLSQSSSFEMPELADAYIFDPNASMLQSLRDSSASARRRSSYVVMNYHQWGSNQEPNGIWNPYKHAKNEFHNYCGSKGEPVTLGQLYNDVSVTCSGSYGGHENCGYATCAEGEVIEQIAFGTTAASTWSPVLTLDFIERVYIDKGPLNPNSQLEGRVAAGNGILPEEAEVIRLCLTDDEARVARHSAN
ncbi:hypothetical protein AK812_SmicGene41671 [Symbiodinium microadriaticum]|uniref:MAM domain-containing protein n=1 Tax=Symbiodinium microadriaticum TaxID=2951 RepID=A0A1Q9C5I3_SYMMI|nr:hypothetical protein AK812_SmicGene41671 [Symbiodinium microadriaticum]